MTDHDQLLEELRPVAFAIAYRMLGSVYEAQDVVLEALLRLIRSCDPASKTASAHAFAITVTTRLAAGPVRAATTPGT